jgi:cell wall-associated NlpC family hydrolase
VAALILSVAWPGGAGADVLVLGSTGPAVANVQRLLGVPATGRYDRATARAVRRFQAAHGLQVDGELGPITMAAMRREWEGTPNAAVLRLGDAGRQVSAVQWSLGLPATGRFDRRTRRAVRNFQRRHGFVVDGEVGPATGQALGLPVRAVVTGPGGAASGPLAGTPTLTLGRAAPKAVRAARIALRELGVPYVWGGESPDGFDCSGLVQYAYARVGVALPRVAADQYAAGRHVALADLQIGDLVFFEHLGHVGLYLGGGRFVHAPHTGAVVHISRLAGWYLEHYAGATRVA